MRRALPMLVQEGSGENLWFAGGLFTLKVTAADSAGEVLMFEHAARRGMTTPLHLHPEHEELGRVLEGEIVFHLDGAEHRAGPGTVVFVPKGTPHALLVTSEVARSLWVVRPATTMEAFLRQAGEVAPSRTLPTGEVDLERLVAAGRRTGALQVLGEPPFSPSILA